MRVARGVRERTRDSGRAGLVQGLLQEFALSSSEGVALMCLAEALLRIPDAATRDALIRDKISSGDWRSHLGQSPSLFVNAATWGLLLTGRLVATHSDVGLGAALRRVVGRGGEPLIRRGVDMAMRLMGEQFVTGETIEQALANARPREAEGFRYSYDMLGEAAMTARDAEAYLAAYEAAIQAIGRASAGRGIVAGPGISIKLSALHPRYSRAQVERVMAELYPRLLQLAELACRYDIGLNIDAEEADRLELSLDLLERLCFEPALAGWNGIGFVIQAYQKRCPAVVDWLIDLGPAQRPPADGAAGEGRLLGRRDQARPARRPGRLSGLHAQGLHRRRLPRLREEAARGAGRDLSAVRDPQRAHPGRRLRARRPGLRGRAVRVPVPARHGRAALRAGGRAGERRQARPAVPDLRAGRHPRHAARLPGAPAARERRQHLVRQSHRQRRGAARGAGAEPGAHGRGARRRRRRDRPAASGDRPAAGAVRRRAGQLARPRSRQRDAAERARPPPSPSTPQRPGRPSRCSASRRSATTPIRCSIRPIAATSSATAATPPPTTCRRRSPRPPTPRPAGRRRRPRRAPRCSKAAPTGSRPTPCGW